MKREREQLVWIWWEVQETCFDLNLPAVCMGRALTVKMWKQGKEAWISQTNWDRNVVNGLDQAFELRMDEVTP